MFQVLFTTRVELDWTDNIGFTATARQFSGLKIDEPVEFHGKDKGPSPVEYFAIGIGGCLGTSFAYCLKKMDVPFKGMKIAIDVDMHHADESGGGVLRITGVTAEINVTLEENGDEEVLDLCIDSFKKYCVVTQSVMAGVPVIVKITHE